MQVWQAVSLCAIYVFFTFHAFKALRCTQRIFCLKWHAVTYNPMNFIHECKTEVSCAMVILQHIMPITIKLVLYRNRHCISHVVFQYYRKRKKGKRRNNMVTGANRLGAIGFTLYGHIWHVVPFLTKLTLCDISSNTKIKKRLVYLVVTEHKIRHLSQCRRSLSPQRLCLYMAQQHKDLNSWLIS